MHGICYNEKDLLTHDVLEVLHKLYVLYMSVRCKIKVERPSDKRYNFRGKYYHISSVKSQLFRHVATF